MSSLSPTLAHAARLLHKAPAFTTIATSLAVGASAASWGLGIALLTRYLSAALLEVEPLHRLTFVLVDFGVLAIVLLASIAPARRAARVDLGSLLRAE
jgi:ABC-type antimicrobial peptide transport system permease subunit